MTTLAKFEPDAIICVHPIVQRVVLASLDQASHTPNSEISALRALPWFTVVTDLCASHPYWFDTRAKRCFVDGPISARYAQKYGLHAEQIRTHGLPIHPAFESLLAKTGKNGCVFSACADLRRKLGMDPHLPAALIMGGGDGVGPVALVADQIAKHFSDASGPRGQLVVLCGHNKSLRRSLQLRSWPVPVRLCGFVENVPEWMAAADCIVTKAGPSTIAEAVSMGKPLALMGFIPGQESENVSFVEDEGVGLYCADPAGLAYIIRRWLIDEPHSRMAFVDAAKKLSTPLAATRIVDETMELTWFSKKGNEEEDIFRQKK